MTDDITTFKSIHNPPTIPEYSKHIRLLDFDYDTTDTKSLENVMNNVIYYVWNAEIKSVEGQPNEIKTKMENIFVSCLWIIINLNYKALSDLLINVNLKQLDESISNINPFINELYDIDERIRDLYNKTNTSSQDIFTSKSFYPIVIKALKRISESNYNVYSLLELQGADYSIFTSLFGLTGMVNVINCVNQYETWLGKMATFDLKSNPNVLEFKSLLDDFKDRVETFVSEQGIKQNKEVIEDEEVVKDKRSEAWKHFYIDTMISNIGKTLSYFKTKGYGDICIREKQKTSGDVKFIDFQKTLGQIWSYYKVNPTLFEFDNVITDFHNLKNHIDNQYRTFNTFEKAPMKEYIKWVKGDGRVYTFLKMCILLCTLEEIVYIYEIYKKMIKYEYTPEEELKFFSMFMISIKSTRTRIDRLKFNNDEFNKMEELLFYIEKQQLKKFSQESRLKFEYQEFGPRLEFNFLFSDFKNITWALETSLEDETKDGYTFKRSDFIDNLHNSTNRERKIGNLTLTPYQNESHIKETLRRLYTNFLTSISYIKEVIHYLTKNLDAVNNEMFAQFKPMFRDKLIAEELLITAEMGVEVPFPLSSEEVGNYNQRKYNKEKPHFISLEDIDKQCQAIIVLLKKMTKSMRIDLDVPKSFDPIALDQVKLNDYRAIVNGGSNLSEYIENKLKNEKLIDDLSFYQMKRPNYGELVSYEKHALILATMTTYLAKLKEFAKSATDQFIATNKLSNGPGGINLNYIKTQEHSIFDYMLEIRLWLDFTIVSMKKKEEDPQFDSSFLKDTDVDKYTYPFPYYVIKSREYLDGEKINDHLNELKKKMGDVTTYDPNTDDFTKYMKNVFPIREISNAENDIYTKAKKETMKYVWFVKGPSTYKPLIKKEDNMDIDTNSIPRVSNQVGIDEFTKTTILSDSQQKIYKVLHSETSNIYFFKDIKKYNKIMDLYKIIANDQNLNFTDLTTESSSMYKDRDGNTDSKINSVIMEKIKSNTGKEEDEKNEIFNNDNVYMTLPGFMQLKKKRIIFLVTDESLYFNIISDKKIIAAFDAYEYSKKLNGDMDEKSDLSYCIIEKDSLWLIGNHQALELGNNEYVGNGHLYDYVKKYNESNSKFVIDDLFGTNQFNFDAKSKQDKTGFKYDEYLNLIVDKVEKKREYKIKPLHIQFFSDFILMRLYYNNEFYYVKISTNENDVTKKERLLYDFKDFLFREKQFRHLFFNAIDGKTLRLDTLNNENTNAVTIKVWRADKLPYLGRQSDSDGYVVLSDNKYIVEGIEGNVKYNYGFQISNENINVIAPNLSAKKDHIFSGVYFKGKYYIYMIQRNIISDKKDTGIYCITANNISNPIFNISEMVFEKDKIKFVELKYRENGFVEPTTYFIIKKNICQTTGSSRDINKKHHFDGKVILKDNSYEYIMNIFTLETKLGDERDKEMKEVYFCEKNVFEGTLDLPLGKRVNFKYTTENPKEIIINNTTYHTNNKKDFEFKSTPYPQLIVNRDFFPTVCTISSLKNDTNDQRNMLYNYLKENSQ